MRKLTPIHKLPHQDLIPLAHKLAQRPGICLGLQKYPNFKPFLGELARWRRKYHRLEQSLDLSRERLSYLALMVKIITKKDECICAPHQTHSMSGQSGSELLKKGARIALLRRHADTTE